MKMETAPKIGREGETIAEKTKFGWMLMSPGRTFNLSEMLQTQTSTADYEELCRLDVLALEDSPTGDQTSIYDEFQEQLTRSHEGWYETSFTMERKPPIPSKQEVREPSKVKQSGQEIREVEFATPIRQGNQGPVRRRDCGTSSSSSERA